MPRVRPGSATRQRRKRVLKRAKGFWGSRSKLFRVAKQYVTKAGQYAFRDRRARKREFRALWIIRVTAACEARGISYSKFMGGLKRASVALNRKMLSEVAIADAHAFDRLVDIAKAHCDQNAAA
ncbi:MAG: 50S ribosomal protein L20 [Phycisphaerales bacterium]|nr:50S ribosomal protein L20 [Phycisphaerales bacterium]